MEKMKKNMMKYGMKNKEDMKKMRKKYEENIMMNVEITMTKRWKKMQK